MKNVRLIHNPTAGDESHTSDELITLIEKYGYKVDYYDIKEDKWKEFSDDTDIVAIAGGDGAVRKVCKQLLKRNSLQKKFPIGVLPLGTANNISRSLGLMMDISELVKSWKEEKIRSVDIGLVSGLEQDPAFFIEAFGFGVFPNLINKMKKMDTTETLSAEDSLNKALETLLEIIRGYKARRCTLTIDGADHSGKFLLVEVMNMPSIGPNLIIDPHADLNDGELEIVVIPENQREKLARYVSSRLEGNEDDHNFSALKGKDISITWEGVHAHIDDSIVKKDERFDVSIDVNHSVLDILIP